MATQIVGLPELPELPEIERLSPLVIRILGGNPGKVTSSTVQSMECLPHPRQFTLQGDIYHN